MYSFQIVLENPKNKGLFIVVSGESDTPIHAVNKVDNLIVDSLNYEIVNFVFQPQKVDDNGKISQK